MTGGRPPVGAARLDHWTPGCSVLQSGSCEHPTSGESAGLNEGGPHPQMGGPGRQGEAGAQSSGRPSARERTSFTQLASLPDRDPPVPSAMKGDDFERSIAIQVRQGDAVDDGDARRETARAPRQGGPSAVSATHLFRTAQGLRWGDSTPRAAGRLTGCERRPNRATRGNQAMFLPGAMGGCAVSLGRGARRRAGPGETQGGGRLLSPHWRPAPTSPSYARHPAQKPARGRATGGSLDVC